MGSSISRSSRNGRSETHATAGFPDEVTPLIATGFQVIPAGSAKFRVTDKAAMYFEIYEPALLAAEVPKLNLALQIRVFDAKGALKFDKEKGRLRSTINILGIAYNQDGSVAARFSDAAKVDFETEKEVEVFKERPYHYENQFDITSGKYNLKVLFSAGR